MNFNQKYSKTRRDKDRLEAAQGQMVVCTQPWWDGAKRVGTIHPNNKLEVHYRDPGSREDVEEDFPDLDSLVEKWGFN